MAANFKQAMIERNREHEELARIMKKNFADEDRNRSLLRYGALAAVFVALFLMKDRLGNMELSNPLKVPKTAKKGKHFEDKMVAQMKSEMAVIDKINDEDSLAAPGATQGKDPGTAPELLSAQGGEGSPQQPALAMADPGENGNLPLPSVKPKAYPAQASMKMVSLGKSFPYQENDVPPALLNQVLRSVVLPPAQKSEYAPSEKDFRPQAIRRTASMSASAEKYRTANLQDLAIVQSLKPHPKAEYEPRDQVPAYLPAEMQRKL